MKELKLNLNELLRYGFAGGFFIIMTLASFKEPRCLILNKEISPSLFIAITTIKLIIGSILYTVHRAIPLWLLYLLFAFITTRGYNIREIDITRWKNLQKQRSLQSEMSEWSAQVHFLYCLWWAGFSVYIIGSFAGWSKTELACPLFWTSIVILIAALIHHIRYQIWEKRVFVLDSNILWEVIIY
jgi:hypothetical protein